MMANVSKTNLVSDIDDPSKTSLNNSKIAVVKCGTSTPNQQIWVKRTGDMQDRYDHQQHTGNLLIDEQIRMNTDIISTPTSPNTSYHENKTRQSYSGSASKYPQIQSMTSYSEPMRTQFESGRSIVQLGDKGKKIHVHKVHHGNARVKYVEFKPVQDRNNIVDMQQHQQQQHPSYKQPMYYQTISSAQSLMVHTPGQSPKSPLHSPPALRPPPSVPPRSIALHSPPSLVPSPDVRPRFEFVGSNHSGVSSGNNSPVQVTNNIHSKNISLGQQKPMNVAAGHQILNVPRISPMVSQQTDISHSQQHQHHIHQKNKIVQNTRVYPNQDGCPLQGKPVRVSSPNISGMFHCSSLHFALTYTTCADSLIRLLCNAIHFTFSS